MSPEAAQAVATNWREISNDPTASQDLKATASALAGELSLGPGPWRGGKRELLVSKSTFIAAKAAPIS